MHRELRRIVLEYGVAVLAVVLAVLLRYLLNPLLDHRLPHITLFGAVAVAVWFGEWRPALLATVIGYIAIDQLIIEPEARSPLSLSSLGGLVGLVLYFASCAVIIIFGSGMRSARRRAEAADRRKDEFLATLGHELRNHLAPLRNGLEIMRLAKTNTTMIEEARDMMERQVTQMVRVVDDLLDLSRIAHGKFELRPAQIELRAVVNSALETCRPVIEAFGHNLSVSLPPEAIAMSADSNRLVQVFSNLLSNACKYTEPGGQIWLSVERHNGLAVVKVKDTGIGIPADMLSQVFEMFTQAEPSREHSRGGLGIGLTLVRRLVELHGGTVDARSDGPGKGSEFVVRLPVLSNGAERL